MISGNFDILNGPVIILDMCPGLEKYVPTFILNKWMKVDVLEKSRDEFNAFVKVFIFVCRF